MKRLHKKVALITGAAQGLGAVYARAMAAEGARVVLSDILDCQPVVKSIIKNGGEALSQVCDVTDNVALKSLVEMSESEYGPIEILVNNAALFVELRRKQFEKIEEDEWDKVMRVNVRGTFQATKAVVPSMRRCGRGKIINISSGTILGGVPHFLHYVTSKGAIMAMTRSLSRELGDDNICVNAIAPGLTESEGLYDHPDYKNVREWNRSLRIFQRDMQPEDLIGALLFLASPDSDFMTGQMINIDGGRIHY